MEISRKDNKIRASYIGVTAIAVILMGMAGVVFPTKTQRNQFTMLHNSMQEYPDQFGTA